MLIDGVAEPVVVDTKTKKKKEKKRPSDFEITRTILQRTNDRKLPFILKDLGEDPDLLVLCSKNEEEFTFGSPDIALALFEFTTSEVKHLVEGVLHKLHGFTSDTHCQRIVNLRDQFSELAKTKGEANVDDICLNAFGSKWVLRPDAKGRDKPFYLCKAIDSLFHMELVHYWCKNYRPLLTTHNPDYLYYDYNHTANDTGSIVTLAPHSNNHPLGHYYPHGFRFMANKGLDVALGKGLDEFPYPLLKQELIVFQDQSVSCQIAHRMIGEGWRMVLLRPNAVYFPTMKTSIVPLKDHLL
jgi:hypothetical protein